MDEMVAFKLPREDLERLRQHSLRRSWQEKRRVGNSEILRTALQLYVVMQDAENEKE